ncbi:MAG: hypothetical protein EZS28_037657, partial [Streblomastix strix]
LCWGEVVHAGGYSLCLGKLGLVAVKGVHMF